MKRAFASIAGTALVSAGLMWSAAVGALPAVFFGEDLSPGGVVPPGGNAATARASFLSGLMGVGNENFEGIAGGTSIASPGIGISFPGSGGSITATLSAGGDRPGGICGLGTVIVGNIGCGFGRFATSGNNYLHSSSSAMTIALSSAIAAFGFFGTDIGDFDGEITLTLTGGATVNLTVPTTQGTAAEGNLVFWGFIDPVDTYTGITFGNTGAGEDVFGFDDMVIGDRQQVTPAPEPASLPLLTLGLLALMLRRRIAR